MLFLAISWVGLFLKFPLTKPYFWFVFALFPILFYLILIYWKKTNVNHLEPLFAIALLLAGAIQYSRFDWLHSLYFLYLIPLTAFYPIKTVLMLSLTVPALEIRHFMETKNLQEEISVNCALILSTLVASLTIRHVYKKNKNLKAEIDTLKKETGEANPASQIGSIRDDTAVEHYLSSMSRADEDIKEVLLAVKHTLLADSVNFFVPSNEGLKLRISAEGTQSIIPSGEGLITRCFKEKKPIISSNISEKGYEVGYIKKGRIASFIAVPVLDELFVLGVLSADTSRYSAYTELDIETLKLFSKQLIRIMQQERVYSHVHREHTGLRVLNKESSRFATSLKFDVLAQMLIESCHKIAPSSIAFLMKKGNSFEIAAHMGNLQIEKKSFSSAGTLLDMVQTDMGLLNLSDVRDYSLPLMPFKTKDVSSVFILPLTYEEELIGMLVFLSEKLNAFHPNQIELLKLLGIQASLSIANARFHAEIERMATIDGLTGLFNHRYFQEKLTEEFRRLERSAEPLSLLLMDIDYFKKVNDTYGHPAGDKILQGVAQILKNTIRDIDMPARYGGEEFTAILPSTDNVGAKNMAERLRRSAMETVFHIDGKPLQITVSIGIATAIGAFEGKKSLIEKADQALYHAKNNGRNQCFLWSEI